MHIKQEAVAGAQRMMLMMINREIYIKLLSQDIYSKAITEKNTADDLNVFPMALNIRIHYEDSSRAIKWRRIKLNMLEILFILRFRGIKK